METCGPRHSIACQGSFGHSNWPPPSIWNTCAKTVGTDPDGIRMVGLPPLCILGSLSEEGVKQRLRSGRHQSTSRLPLQGPNLLTQKLCVRSNRPNRCGQFTGQLPQIDGQGWAPQTFTQKPTGAVLPRVFSARTGHREFVGYRHAGHFEDHLRPHPPQRLAVLAKTGTHTYALLRRSSFGWTGAADKLDRAKRMRHHGTRTHSEGFDFFDDRFVGIVVQFPALARSHGHMPAHA